MRTLGWFQSRWPLKRFGNTKVPESRIVAAPQTVSSQTSSLQLTFQRRKCWLITVLWWLKLGIILLCRFWCLTFCSYLLLKAPTLWYFCSALSSSLNPHLATEVRNTILILFVGKFKLKKKRKKMRWMQNRSWSSWAWTRSNFKFHILSLKSFAASHQIP